MFFEISKISFLIRASPYASLFSNGSIGACSNEKDKESDYFAMGFRLYDPEIGRFLAIDPLLDMQPSQTPYHYCFNNPTSFTDPTGLYPEKEKGDKVQDMQSMIFYDEFEYLRREYGWKMVFMVIDTWNTFAWMHNMNEVNRLLGGNESSGGYGGGGSSSGREGTIKSINGIALAIGTTDERKRIIEGLAIATNSKILTDEHPTLDITFITGFIPNSDYVYSLESIDLFNDARGRLNAILGSNELTCFLFQDKEFLAERYKQVYPESTYNKLVGLSYYEESTGSYYCALAKEFVYNNETTVFNKWVDNCGYYRLFTYMETFLHEFGHNSDRARMGTNFFYQCITPNFRERYAIEFSNQYLIMWGKCKRPLP